jgi:hypothetical protein
MVFYGAIVFDLLAVICMLSPSRPFRLAGSLVVICIAITGIALSLASVSDCGCFGAYLRLTVLQHRIVASTMGALACLVFLFHWKRCQHLRKPV